MKTLNQCTFLLGYATGKVIGKFKKFFVGKPKYGQTARLMRVESNKLTKIYMNGALVGFKPFGDQLLKDNEKRVTNLAFYKDHPNAKARPRV